MRRRSSITMWLLRAGDTEWDEADRLRGDEELPMSRGGLAATTEAFERAAGMAFPRPGRIHHPLDPAAAETARIAARTIGGRPKGDDELADPALGVLAVNGKRARDPNRKTLYIEKKRRQGG